MKGIFILLAVLAYYSSSSPTTLVLATLTDKRAPPFPQAANFPARLGNYTHSHENVEKPTYTCVLLGDCDVCTSLEKKTAPFCLEYGNKEPVHCEWDDPNWMTNKNDTSYDHDDDMISLPTYRACPYVKRIEKWRLIRFEIINCIVAALSVLVFIWRQRKLARDKYEQMAERIGTTSA